MRVCIYGAGAIGGHLAARLIAREQCEVSIIARGAHLDAIRAKGLWLKTQGKEIGGRPVAATDNPADLPPQDLVVVALKAHGLPAIAEPLSRLVAPDGRALFATNGIPWWWNYGRNGDGGALPLLDPDRTLWNIFRPQRALGAVIYSSNSVTEPGIITHAGPARRWQIGELDNTASTRVQNIVDLFAAADLDATLSHDIRRDIWRKLCVNVSGNPIGALTRLTSREAANVPDLDRVGEMAILETLAVAAAEGFDLRGEVDAHAVAAPSGTRNGARSSMLQDVDGGRALECDAILGQIQVFGRETQTPTPTIEVVLALLRGLDRALALLRQKG